MPRGFGQAGVRWAQARNAHCSTWARNFNAQFRTMSSGAYLVNTCEYFPLGGGGGRVFAEKSITGNAVNMLLSAENEGLGASAAVDEAIAAYLSGK